MRPMPTADAAQIDRAFHALADESRRAMVVEVEKVGRLESPVLAER